MDVGGGSGSRSISGDTDAGAGNLAADSGGGIFAGERGANGGVVLERLFTVVLVGEQLLGESVGVSFRHRGVPAAVAEPVQPLRLVICFCFFFSLCLIIENFHFHIIIISGDSILSHCFCTICRKKITKTFPFAGFLVYFPHKTTIILLLLGLIICYSFIICIFF